jgi:lysophospholipid acyltransferase (LPLAT)-like uncharacterized protein
MDRNVGSGKVVVRHITWPQRLLLRILYLPVKLYYATLRYHAEGDDLKAVTDISAPSVLVIWHNRILTSPKIKRKYRDNSRLFAAISASRDGALISAFVEMFDIESCRGSSSKRGALVALEMVEELKHGHDIAVTPDGPRGPLYAFHEGAAAVALMSGAPLTIVCPAIRSGMRFNSWDGFYLPWPFSRVDMRAKRFLPDALPKDRAQCADFLRCEMLKLTEDLPEPQRVRAAREKEAAKAAPTTDNSRS